MKVGDYVRFKTLSREIKIGRVKELLEHIYNQDKEIERLNNIINELEKGSENNE